MRFSPIAHLRHTAGTIVSNPLRLRVAGAERLHAGEATPGFLTPARRARGYEAAAAFLMREVFDIP